MDPVEEIIQDLNDFAEVNNHPLTLKAAAILSVLNKLNNTLKESVAAHKNMLKIEQNLSNELAQLLNHSVFDHDSYSWCENRSAVLEKYRELRADSNEDVSV